MNATVTPLRSAAESGIAEQFSAIAAKLPGDAAVTALRERAVAGLARTGLPNRRVEAYKYTDLRAMMRTLLKHAPELPAQRITEVFAKAPPLLSPGAAHLVRIVNGYLVSPTHLLPDAGIDVLPLHNALASGHPVLTEALTRGVSGLRDDPVFALNAAFMLDGVHLRVPAGVTVEKPVHLHFETVANTAVASYPRIVLVVEEGASVTLVESHRGPDGIAYQTNVAIDIRIAAGAKVEHVRLQAEGDAALSLSTLAVTLEREAQVDSLSFVSGAAASRHQVFARFAGDGARAGLRGATMLRKRQHADTTLVVDHVAPHGESREVFKTVLEDDSTGVFQGRINVAKDAQKTDGRMASNALMLSDGATMNNKPELEIFADDVQCAHGATCGALDEDLLFYLRARGIPLKEAEALMVRSFVGEAIDTVTHEGVRDGLGALADRWLVERR